MASRDLYNTLSRLLSVAPDHAYLTRAAIELQAARKDGTLSADELAGLVEIGRKRREELTT